MYQMKALKAEITRHATKSIFLMSGTLIIFPMTCKIGHILSQHLVCVSFVRSPNSTYNCQNHRTAIADFVIYRPL